MSAGAAPDPGQGIAWNRSSVGSWTCATPPSVTTFHAGMDGHVPTTLHDLPELAAELGVDRVLVKEESARFGLPAFKVLGVSWAVARVVLDRAGHDPSSPVTWAAARTAARARPDLVLVTATDGNHGRALARLARWLGLSARIHVPAVMAAGPAAAIADEGADVVRVDGTYDQAVAAAATDADGDPHAVLVQDTAWPGYETVPGWIVEGYTTLSAEVDDQLTARGVVAADLTVVPTGVGSLAQSVVSWVRSRPARPDGRHRGVVAAEPATAACVVASLRADGRRTVDTGATVMAGLNCGTPSSLAWPVLQHGLDAAVAVPDEAATTAVADLRVLGVDAGPSGAASLAAVRRLLGGPGHRARRERLGLGDDAVVVLMCTEGRAGAAP